MAGAIAIVILLVIVFPVVVMLSGGALAAVLGGLIKASSDADNVSDDGQPNEYLVISRTDHYADRPAETDR